MKNLLQETIELMDEFNKSERGILFIGSSITNHACTWEEFKILADREYDETSGEQRVCWDLIIVFKDHSWFSRVEPYYGSIERWKFNKTPSLKENPQKIESIIYGSYNSIANYSVGDFL